MTLEEKVAEYISKNGMLNRGSQVLCGLSGGADSICLTFILKKLGYKVYALHVEHGIRGEEALRDASFAEEFCIRHGIDFFTESIDVPKIAKEKKLSLETCARNERYALLAEYADKLNCPIAVAHNKDDQAETVLMHLVRGSGLNGLCGMDCVTGNIIRPLLCTRRSEIEEYLNLNKLKYVTDSTNGDSNYSRNRMRLEVIPQLKNINSNVTDSIFSCSELLKGYRDFFESTCEKEFSSLLLSCEENKLKLKMRDLDPVIRDGVIRLAVKKINGHTVDLEKKHTEDIASLFSKQSGKEVHLPFSLHVRREFDTLVFCKSEETVFEETEFLPDRTYLLPNCTVSSHFTDNARREKNCECVDFDKLPQKLTLRTRRSGDRITPLGMSGSMTLKKYFIGRKIPKDIRDSLPLIASDDEILVILGNTVSEKVKISQSTKKILKICKE